MGRQGSEPVRLRSAPQPELVPTERNIEESYLFAGGANGENEIREYVIDVVLEDGRKAQRRFRYTPSKEYGDTTDFDRDVYRAIILHAFRTGVCPRRGSCTSASTSCGRSSTCLRRAIATARYANRSSSSRPCRSTPTPTGRRLRASRANTTRRSTG